MEIRETIFRIKMREENYFFSIRIPIIHVCIEEI